MENNEQMIHGMTLNTYVGLMNILFIVPSVGWIASIVFWAIGKDKSEYVDIRGKDMLNFMISYVIYTIVLCFGGVLLGILIPFGGMAVGILIAIVLGLYGLVCPIIAGVKAFNGEDWRYPFTIQLIK